jgi:hypothetical protein
MPFLPAGIAFLFDPRRTRRRHLRYYAGISLTQNSTSAGYGLDDDNTNFGMLSAPFAGMLSLHEAVAWFRTKEQVFFLSERQHSDKTATNPIRCTANCKITALRVCALLMLHHFMQINSRVPSVRRNTVNRVARENGNPSLLSRHITFRAEQSVALSRRSDVSLKSTCNEAQSPSACDGHTVSADLMAFGKKRTRMVGLYFMRGRLMRPGPT